MASANRFAWSFYFRTSSHCQRWEKYYISLDWWIQRLGPLVSKQTQFSGFNSWARVFKGGSKREKQRKRKLSAVTIRFTDRKTLVKPNKLQTGLFQPLKVSLSFTVIKLLNINLELLTEKYWIKPIPILLKLNISLTANNHFWYCCPFFASDFQDLCTIPPAML